LKHQGGVDTYDDCCQRDVITPKIRRKRISRGVQYNVSAGQRSRLFLHYFRLRPRKKKYNPSEEIGEREILRSERIIRIPPRNQASASLVEEIIGRRFKGNDRNTRHDKKGRYPHTIPEMSEDKGDNRKLKKSSFERFITILTCKNIPKMQRCNVPSIDDDSPKDKGETIEPSNFKGTSSECSGPRSEKLGVNVFRCPLKNDSNNARTALDVNSGDESDVNEARKKLDCCIAELNDIISDACVVFGSKRAQCRGGDAVHATVCE